MLTTSRSTIDSDLETLSDAADKWASEPISQRLALLTSLRDLVAEHAAEWVDAAVAGKHIPKGSPLEGEEWISGPYPMLTWLSECEATLTALQQGTNPLDGLRLRSTSTGRVAVRVYPTTVVESLLLHGYDVEVWMDDDLTHSALPEAVGSAYRTPPPAGTVALVLGAGNISSIPPLDVVHKLFVERAVVVVKLNPVNDYLGPVFEKIFAPLIEQGYVRFAYGDGEVGAYLTHHALVDTVHITGSAVTHDKIVFGSGDEGRRRKAAADPVLRKPITSELGGVSPTIVVPGPWTEADISYQAEHIASQKLHNSGFNCVASQVLVMPEGWTQGPALHDAIADVMHRAEDRHPYYPGAEDRHAAAIDAAHTTTRHGHAGRRAIVHGLDPASEHHSFTTEHFAPVLATTSLPAATPAEYLRAAVRFANERLHGTLGANIIVHPKTMAELGRNLERAIENLHYGSVAVNTWTGVAFLITRAAWGAAPGHTIGDVQSGIGMVHNSLMFDRAVKTVVRAPFHPFPRGLRHGSFGMSPRPPWFVTNRTAAETTSRLTYFAADGKLRRLPAIFARALRG